MSLMDDCEQIYLFRFLHIFLPSITLYQVAIFYPILCFSISMILFFFLTRYLFDLWTSLIPTAFFAVFPLLVPRSMAGFSDRDVLCLLLSLSSFLLFIRSFQSSRIFVRYTSVFLSGLMQMLIGITWEGSGLFSSVIIIFLLVKLFWNRFDIQHFYLYLMWIIPVLSGIFLLTKSYLTLAPFALLAWGLPLYLM
ncbi:TPA: hypothetical protein EYP66_15545 [Candidatus Poribacteria bacterium]|nr:hypothetical protein [Candidatus Poribacteria bacterium]